MRETLKSLQVSKRQFYKWLDSAKDRRERYDQAVAAGKQKRKAGLTAVVEVVVPEPGAPDGEQAALEAKNSALAAENAALRRKVAALERLTEVEVTDVETGTVAVHHQAPAEAERRLKRAGEALSAAGARVQRVKLERGAAEAAAARAVSEAEYEAEERDTMVTWSVRQTAAIERLEALAMGHGADPVAVRSAARI